MLRRRLKGTHRWKFRAGRSLSLLCVQPGAAHARSDMCKEQHMKGGSCSRLFIQTWKRKDGEIVT